MAIKQSWACYEVITSRKELAPWSYHLSEWPRFCSAQCDSTPRKRIASWSYHLKERPWYMWDLVTTHSVCGVLVGGVGFLVVVCGGGVWWCWISHVFHDTRKPILGSATPRKSLSFRSGCRRSLASPQRNGILAPKIELLKI